MEKQILYCKCQGDIIDANIVQKIEEELLPNIQAQTFVLQDLCGLCANDRETLKDTIEPADNILLLACHKRSVSALLEFAGLKARQDKIELVDMLEDDMESIQCKMNEFSGPGGSHSPTLLKSDPNWPAWYPVLDYERCVNCGQCADFCLFGTYTKEDGKVLVTQPDACKNNCPACARICPEAAIIFPKYAEGGAISGTDNINEKAEHERVQQDVEQILGNDIYAALEKRKAKRKRLIKRESMDKAMQERDNALKKTDFSKLRFNPFGEEKSSHK